MDQSHHYICVSQALIEYKFWLLDTQNVYNSCLGCDPQKEQHCKCIPCNSISSSNNNEPWPKQITVNSQKPFAFILFWLSKFCFHVQNKVLTFVANVYVCKVETFKSLTRKHIYVLSWTVQSLTAVLQSHIYEHQSIREPRKGNLRIFQHHNMWKSNMQISKACRMQINFHTSIVRKKYVHTFNPIFQP